MITAYNRCGASYAIRTKRFNDVKLSRSWSTAWTQEVEQRLHVLDAERATALKFWQL
jgi:hypothetical protein